MTQEKTALFKDSTSITEWTKWTLYANVAIAVVAIVSSLMESQLLLDLKNGVFISDETAEAAGNKNDIRQGIIGLIQLVLFIMVGVFILMWIYRANNNARALGTTEMEYTPGWSVGWYFIPIANLVKPYSAMKEIWKASSNPKDWNNQPVSPLLGWWWFFWIVSNALGRASYKLSSKAEEINDFIISNIVTQVSDAVDIPLCLIVVAIVKRVYEMQNSHSKLLAPKYFPEGGPK
jgi:hypothetical protein